ncbi:MAG: methylmalonyl Co-A mutase-associated GTPase MeaB [Chloroflexi bacterium CG_4_9_14_3_um_filter_45_9]|nr:MAG: methylmalonyl Co-A mutase-associated GTPase MeaB [Chloroflexi bacterium CG_4_9_14_3_um_filter_45_9]
MELVEQMLKGEIVPLSRVISLVENESKEMPEIMKLIAPRAGKAYCVGITGPPGSGKSTLVDKLTAIIRKQDLTVGIIAADPSSPFTGGAVLGDRIRMQQHYLDEGVFIRSMASRGSLGGLPQTTGSVIKVLDAFGKDIILVETVGVGQSEIDIMKNSDTVVVVLCPEAGDSIQTMKAGLFEIADIFVVNKADHPGADNLINDIQSMLHLHNGSSWWDIPALATEAVNNVGIEELYQQIQRHRRILEETGRLTQRRQKQRRDEFFETIKQKVGKRLIRAIEQDSELANYAQRVESGEIDPYSAADKVLKSGKLLDAYLKLQSIDEQRL